MYNRVKEDSRGKHEETYNNSGVPRAGKSTVSQIIAKQFGYQHISMDSVIAGIEKIFSKTGIDTDAAVEPHTNLE